MDSMAFFGKIIIFAGIVIVFFGVVILIISAITGGRGLPGDIIIRRENITIYFPIITSIVISIILTLLIWLIFSLRR